jgi:Holin of 3TMs, for gene-transfer release
MSLDPISAVLDIGSKIIERVWPDPVQAANAKLELLKLQQSGELAQIAGQLSINQVEASSSSVWVSGWRPFCGWIGGAGLGYAAIVEPISRFFASVVFDYTGTFPILDTTITMQVLFGMLGLGVMRSYDKKQGTST